MGVALKEKMDAAGVECVLDIPEESYPDPYGSTGAFILDKLSTPTSGRNALAGGRMVPQARVSFRKTAQRGIVAHIPSGSLLLVFDAAGREVARSKKGGAECVVPANVNGVLFYSLTHQGAVQHGKVNLVR